MKGKRARSKPKTASKKANESEQIYKPKTWAWRLIRAYLDPDVPSTITARCKDGGVGRTVFYDELKKPEFVQWFQGMLQEAVLSDSSDVRQAHLRLCLNGHLDAIKLWYERYGEFIPTQRFITGDLSNVSDKALDAIDRILEAASPKGEEQTVH